MPWWIGSPVAVLLFWTLSSATMLIYGRTHRGDVVFWRDIETTATLIGGVSLIMLTINAEHFFNLRVYESQKNGYVGAAAVLRSHADHVVYMTCDISSIRTEASPRNFDDIETDKKVICGWAKELKEKIDNVHYADLEKIDPSWFISPVQITTHWSYIFDDYKQSELPYEKFRSQLLTVKDQSDWGDWEMTTLAFAPYLVALAVSMQLAKARYK